MSFILEAQCCFIKISSALNHVLYNRGEREQLEQHFCLCCMTSRTCAVHNSVSNFAAGRKSNFQLGLDATFPPESVGSLLPYNLRRAPFSVLQHISVPGTKTIVRKVLCVCLCGCWCVCSIQCGFTLSLFPSMLPCGGEYFHHIFAQNDHIMCVGVQGSSEAVTQ